MNKKLINPQFNQGGKRSLQHNLNDIILQLHANEEIVSNPYTFSITRNRMIISAKIIPKTGMVKVYGTKPWYYFKFEDKIDKATAIDNGMQLELKDGITDMTMFAHCSNLTSIDLSKLNTSNAINMNSMFEYCSGLTSLLGLSKFNTSNVTNMAFMFYYCSKLTSIDLSSFDTSKVTNMAQMFTNCKSLTSLDLSRFNTSNVTKMGSMFSYCDKLTSLDLSSFDTSNVTDMVSMFMCCPELTSLDLSSFDTSKVTHISNMFISCPKLTSIICPNGFDCSSIEYKNGNGLTYVFSDDITNLKSPLHLRKVPNALIESGSSPSNWVIKGIGGTRGVHYIVDSVI